MMTEQTETASLARNEAREAIKTSEGGGARAVAENKLVILFDGHCRFCTQSAKKLARFFGPARVSTVNFQDEGVLAGYPGVTYDAAMKRMHVVEPSGRVYAGAAAFARLFRALRFIGWLGYFYYVPGIKQLAELSYDFIAKNRYRFFGKTEACEPGGTCHLHQ
jgi:predicted DCC family thiol-disulfide oxidoreductase YuxK